ncbi:MAG: hypothetical protein SF187_15560 [Deltaproteobacteria bacterium]|nr:hypothetical protein [Deltaproteobacteria bacterium]
MRRRAAVAIALLCACPSRALWAQAVATQTGDANDDEPVQGYSPTPAGPTVVTAGYVDVGFADAQGNGTSWVPGDTRVPNDYGVDAFAPAVNSRGDVASTNANAANNGFVPRSVGIGGRPSFLLNTISADLRASNANGSYLVFVRAQAMPRFLATGEQTQVLIEQAFARVIPFASHEFALTIGKADAVFGIEYLDNQATLRTGITPSLMARYTTGTQLGAKAFYRTQLPRLWSALSINVAATNGPTFIEALQTQSASLTGRPVLSGRAGYELNLPRFQLKLGVSALQGPRNDQRQSAKGMRLWGADARLYVAGLSLSGEYVDVQEDDGDAAEKLTPLGPRFWASEFEARGFWAQAAWSIALPWRWLERATPYVRLGYRRARFEGFPQLDVARLTTGVRFDLAESVVVKGEWLFNQERRGAPNVANDVRAISVVFIW